MAVQYVEQDRREQLVRSVVEGQVDDARWPVTTGLCVSASLLGPGRGRDP